MTGSLYIVFVVYRNELHCLCKPDLYFNDVVNVAFLSRRTLLVHWFVMESKIPHMKPDVHLAVDVTRIKQIPEANGG